MVLVVSCLVSARQAPATDIFNALLVLSLTKVNGDVPSLEQPYRPGSLRRAKCYLAKHCHLSRMVLDTMDPARVKVAAWVTRYLAPADGNPSPMAVSFHPFSVVTQQPITFAESMMRQKAIAVLRNVVRHLTCVQRGIVASFSNYLNHLWDAVGPIHNGLVAVNFWINLHPADPTAIYAFAHIPQQLSLSPVLTVAELALAPLYEAPPQPPPPPPPPPPQPEA